MIRTLQIRNFKSVKELRLNCRRINVFIGEPNTGKSNILEALGFLSFLGHGGSLSSYVRFQDVTNLFFDMDLSNEIEIGFEAEGKGASVRVKFEGGSFNVYLGSERVCSMGMDGTLLLGPLPHDKFKPFKFYRFKALSAFQRTELPFLYPPHGENLVAVLLTNKDVRMMVGEVFRKFGLRLVVKPIERTIEVQKEYGGIAISYPYGIVSETLQRTIFHLVAVETNRDSVIVFEEPEASSFPFYTKFLAERIAFDRANQYFISTHNPYMLIPLLEKAPEEDVQVFVTYLEGGQTRVRALSEEEKAEILDLDASVFFNLDKFVGA